MAQLVKVLKGKCPVCNSTVLRYRESNQGSKSEYIECIKCGKLFPEWNKRKGGEG